jgi:tetratricopeptide (TPR) repeat protein
VSTKNNLPGRGENRRLPLAILVAVLAAVPYLNGIRNGFTFDDVSLVAENPRLRATGAVSSAFTSDWWNGKRPQSLLYRPLTLTSFAIDYAVARSGAADPPPARLPSGDAVPFHVQNLLWHVAASVALFLLVLTLFASPGLAAATAALFAVHPVHTEAVDGIVGRAELMSACFAFLALLVASRILRDDAPGLARPALAGALLWLALLSKEQAIVVPALPLVWLASRSPAERGAVMRRSSFKRLMAALALATCAYLALRTAVLGSPVAAFKGVSGTVVVDNPVAGAAGLGRLLTPVGVFGRAAGLIVYPRTLSADYSYDQIPVVTALDAATAFSALLLSGLIAGAVRFRRVAPAVSLGLAFFLLAWAVTSNLFVLIGTIFGERLLYLPSAGACLAIASGLTALLRRIPVPRLSLGVVALLVLGLSARTWARNPDWKDNASLFAATAAASPRSCKALDGYASELLAAGRPQEALGWAGRALRVYPDYPGAHQTMAKSLRLLANETTDPEQQAEWRREATVHAEKLVALFTASVGGGNGLADAWSVMGGLALDRGDVDGALEAFGKSLARDPTFIPSIIGSGVALANKEDHDGALSRFQQAVALDPGNAEARQHAAEMLRRAAGDAASLANLHGVRGTEFLRGNRLVAALAEFREAARLQPTAARAYLGIGTVLSTQAEAEPDANRKRALVDEALAAFEHALTLEPDNAEAHFDLGITYLRQRPTPAKVAEHFRAYLRLVPEAPQRAQMEETIRRMEAPR